MKTGLVTIVSLTISIICFSLSAAHAEADSEKQISAAIIFVGFCLLILLLRLSFSGKRLAREAGMLNKEEKPSAVERLSSLSKDQLTQLANHTGKGINKGRKILGLALLFTFFSSVSLATPAENTDAVLTSPGMLIMLTLVLIPLIVLVAFAGIKVKQLAYSLMRKRIKLEAITLSRQLDNNEELYQELIHRMKALDYTLNNHELAGDIAADDKKGLLHHIAEVNTIRFIAPKRKAAKKHDANPELVRLITWFLGTATFWLVAGTTIGEYLGIKFVAPDVDHVSWLSFGRLRPVHTNMVFWGWSTLAMIGLGYYVVSTVSNNAVHNIRFGYYSLILLNAAVLIGSWSLMAGINNGGGEYREYIWPVMGVFAAGIVVTLYNYLKTIAQRKISEIYISNWYIIAAVMFLTVIVVVGYIPWWQNGLGETIIQGFYMHQAVGMWFMLFTLGLVYYFLPQQLNTPIYSYSLGILAFWSQILFYTLIGTHHFIFSSIPWWLQTVAIVGSMGMLIPVFSGTTNFLMTFRGNFHRIARSYTLPFYLTGIIFYFTGSTQGTAEAFRATNLIWHFTDFTVAHSHLTMYGIIAFLLWGCIYTLLPRLTGKEPKQGTVGAHFWLALIGMLFYTIPLMVGGTIKGMGWVAGKPFIDGIVVMAPYWLWRAIGGSLMWVSHLVFAYNMYAMVAVDTEAELKEKVYKQLDQQPAGPAV